MLYWGVFSLSRELVTLTVPAGDTVNSPGGPVLETREKLTAPLEPES